jgi:DMSO reductase family type II enzyme chaperone
MNRDPAAELPDRQVVGRDDRELAQLRCIAYGVCSELVASPHDLDPRQSLRSRLGIGEVLETAGELDLVMSALVERDIDELKREYSGLFEVGSDGPPVSIREDIQTGQHAGTREDLVRFYDFFGYSLAERFAWAPDHLSVELEFMHFLCYGEASSEDDALPFQLAQADFATRHFAWLSDWSRSVVALQPDSLYARVASAVSRFAADDLDWQQGTIVISSGR